MNINKIAALAAAALTICGCNNQSDQLKMLVGTYTEGNDSRGTYLFSFNQADATFELLSTAEAGNPSFVVPSVGGNGSGVAAFAYGVKEFNDGRQGAYAYRLSENGVEVINEQSTDGEGSGADPCNVLLLDGKVITSNYTGGSISVFPIAEDGSLKPMSQQWVAQRNETGRDPHMHCAVLSPDGKYIFATDLGSDAIMRFDRVQGDQPLAGARVAFQLDTEEHPGPRHMIFSPDGHFAYVLCELADKLFTFTYNDGELNLVSERKAYPGDGKGSADLHISPDGYFLYTSHRLEQDGISVFFIDKHYSGDVQPLAFQPTGKHPRNFAITPNGKYLLCACRDSDVIEIYSINEENGALSLVKTIELPSPVCVQFFN